MDRTVKTRRYDASARRARAEENRAAVLRAAHRLFLERGYARASVAAIAQEAGVSADLVYKVFGKKQRLLVEVLNFAVTGESDPPRVLDQPGPQAVRAETDQHRQVAMFAEDAAARIGRARPVDDVMRSAGEVDPAVAAKRTAMHRTRLAHLREFVEAVARNGPLRGGLPRGDAAASVWLLAGPEVHRLLVDELGWDHEHYERWLHHTLEAVLLPPGAG